MAAFRDAARGAGVIPWHLDLDRIEEDCFHLLVSPPAPRQRTLAVLVIGLVVGIARSINQPDYPQHHQVVDR